MAPVTRSQTAANRGAAQPARGGGVTRGLAGQRGTRGATRGGRARRRGRGGAVAANQPVVRGRGGHRGARGARGAHAGRGGGGGHSAAPPPQPIVALPAPPPVNPPPPPAVGAPVDFQLPHPDLILPLPDPIPANLPPLIAQSARRARHVPEDTETALVIPEGDFLITAGKGVRWKRFLVSIHTEVCSSVVKRHLDEARAHGIPITGPDPLQIVIPGYDANDMGRLLFMMEDFDVPLPMLQLIDLTELAIAMGCIYNSKYTIVGDRISENLTMNLEQYWHTDLDNDDYFEDLIRGLKIAFQIKDKRNFTLYSQTLITRTPPSSLHDLTFGRASNVALVDGRIWDWLDRHRRAYKTLVVSRFRQLTAEFINEVDASVADMDFTHAYTLPGTRNLQFLISNFETNDNLSAYKWLTNLRTDLRAFIDNTAIRGETLQYQKALMCAKGLMLISDCLEQLPQACMDCIRAKIWDDLPDGATKCTRDDAQHGVVQGPGSDPVIELLSDSEDD